MNTLSTRVLPDAAGCLGSIPSRAGMSFVSQTMLLAHMTSGGNVMLFDNESSGKTSSFAAFLNNITQEHVAKIPVAAKTCAVGEEPPFERKTDFVAKLGLARPLFSQLRRIN